jgi:hypothetical protein
MQAPKLWLSLVLLSACIPARRAIPPEPARSARPPDSAIADQPRQAAGDTFPLRRVWVRIEALEAGQQSRTQPGPTEFSLSGALQE